MRSIKMYNVIFVFRFKNETELENYKLWEHYFDANREMWRTSVIFAMLDFRKIDYWVLWDYCTYLTLQQNWRAFWGFQKQLRAAKNKPVEIRYFSKITRYIYKGGHLNV